MSFCVTVFGRPFVSIFVSLFDCLIFVCLFVRSGFFIFVCSLLFAVAVVVVFTSDAGTSDDIKITEGLKSHWRPPY